MQGSYLLQTSFISLLRKHRTGTSRVQPAAATSQLLIFCSFLGLPYLQRPLMSYDEPDRKIHFSFIDDQQPGGQRSEQPVPAGTLHRL